MNLSAASLLYWDLEEVPPVRVPASHCSKEVIANLCTRLGCHGNSACPYGYSRAILNLLRIVTIDCVTVTPVGGCINLSNRKYSCLLNLGCLANISCSGLQYQLRLLLYASMRVFIRCSWFAVGRQEVSDQVSGDVDLKRARTARSYQKSSLRSI